MFSFDTLMRVKSPEARADGDRRRRAAKFEVMLATFAVLRSYDFMWDPKKINDISLA